MTTDGFRKLSHVYRQTRNVKTSLHRVPAPRDRLSDNHTDTIDAHPLFVERKFLWNREMNIRSGFQSAMAFLCCRLMEFFVMKVRKPTVYLTLNKIADSVIQISLIPV